MATGNFYCKNTSCIYAIGMNHYTTQEDIDVNDWDQELLGTLDENQTNCNFEWQKGQAQELLDQKGWSTMDEYDPSSNRCYPASIIAEVTRCRVFAGVSIDVTMQASVVSGYYEGANFDLEATMKVYDRDGYLVTTVDDLEYIEATDSDDVISENWTGNNGLTKIHAARLIKVLQELVNELRNEAEAAFNQACEYKLGVAYRCSNGETGYSIINDEPAA